MQGRRMHAQRVEDILGPSADYSMFQTAVHYFPPSVLHSSELCSAPGGRIMYITH